LAAAVYAYAFMFPAGGAPGAGGFDSRVRLTADIYDLGLTLGLMSAEGDTVDLDAGSRPLPFGQLDLSVNPDSFLWRGYRLNRFIPVAEFEPRGLLNNYRQAGVGAPLAAEVAPAGEGRAAEAARERIPRARTSGTRRSRESFRRSARCSPAASSCSTPTGRGVSPSCSSTAPPRARRGGHRCSTSSKTTRCSVTGYSSGPSPTTRATRSSCRRRGCATRSARWSWGRSRDEGGSCGGMGGSHSQKSPSSIWNALSTARMMWSEISSVGLWQLNG